jgi:hypothetical protein
VQAYLNALASAWLANAPSGATAAASKSGLKSNDSGTERSAFIAARSTSPRDNHTMSVVDIDGAASLLRAKREALLNQLAAVDRALATLAAAEVIVANAQDLQTAEPEAQATEPVVPTRVTPRRVLSDEHRHALTEGLRKARHSKAAAAGQARETLDPTPGLTPTSATEPPRLVKRTIRK